MQNRSPKIKDWILLCVFYGAPSRARRPFRFSGGRGTTQTLLSCHQMLEPSVVHIGEVARAGVVVLVRRPLARTVDIRLPQINDFGAPLVAVPATATNHVVPVVLQRRLALSLCHHDVSRRGPASSASLAYYNMIVAPRVGGLPRVAFAKASAAPRPVVAGGGTNVVVVKVVQRGAVAPARGRVVWCCHTYGGSAFLNRTARGR